MTGVVGVKRETDGVQIRIGQGGGRSDSSLAYDPLPGGGARRGGEQDER